MKGAPRLNQLPVSLWRRRQRQDSQGLAPIMLRATVDGVRCELTTGVCCPEAYWPLENGSPGTSPGRLVMPADKAEWVLPHFSAEAIARLNDEINQCKQDVEETYRRLRQPVLRGPLVPVDAEALREALRGPSPAKAKKKEKLRLTLLQVASAFIEATNNAPELSRLAPSTLRSYDVRHKTLIRYLKSEHKSNLLASEVDIPWCRRYERWLVSEVGGHCGLSMRKQVNFVQMALSYAVHEGWVPTVALHGYKFQTRLMPPPAVSLSANQVQELVQLLPELDLPARRAVAGWLFCCYTGLSWVDYSRFCQTPGKFLFAEPDANGTVRYWLRMVRQKMKNRKPQGFSVPFFDAAADLLVWYRGHLPTTHLVNTNKLLGRVAEEIGLKEGLTTKLARSTFSQMRRDEGYSDEAVAAMMGDTVSVMNRHYSKVSERRIALEIGNIGQPTSFLQAT